MIWSRSAWIRTTPADASPTGELAGWSKNRNPSLPHRREEISAAIEVRTERQEAIFRGVVISGN